MTERVKGMFVFKKKKISRKSWTVYLALCKCAIIYIYYGINKKNKKKC